MEVVDERAGEMEHVPVSFEASLRLPRRARCVDDVGERVRRDVPPARVVSRRCRVDLVKVDCAGTDAGDLGRVRVKRPLGEEAAGPEVIHDGGATGHGLVHVQGHVELACLQHPEERHERVGAVAEKERHGLGRVAHLPQQRVRDTIGGTVELRVCQLAVPVLDREAVRAGGDLLGEPSRDRLLDRGPGERDNYAGGMNAPGTNRLLPGGDLGRRARGHRVLSLAALAAGNGIPEPRRREACFLDTTPGQRHARQRFASVAGV